MLIDELVLFQYWHQVLAIHTQKVSFRVSPYCHRVQAHAVEEDFYVSEVGALNDSFELVLFVEVVTPPAHNEKHFGRVLLFTVNIVSLGEVDGVERDDYAVYEGGVFVFEVLDVFDGSMVEGHCYFCS